LNKAYLLKEMFGRVLNSLQVGSAIP
jgi:hypothetical protein